MDYTKIKFSLEEKHAHFLMGCLTFFVFFILSLKNHGLYPMAFADEYTYSRLSRNLDLSESNIPGYFYLFIYSITRTCGDGFLGCAKLINSFFFSLSLLPIFLISRKVNSSWIALTVCVFTVFGGVSSYVTYFMPESMFFFGFWFFSWFFLSLNEKSSICKWLAAAGIFGLLSLVKPHAILFSPALACYIIYIHYKIRNVWVRGVLLNGTCFFLFAFFTKFFLSYIFAGPAGITLFGSSYNSMASPSSLTLGKLYDLLSGSFENFIGHFLVLTLLYGAPLLLAIKILLPSIGEGVKSEKEKIAFFFIFVLFNLVVATALFTAVAVSTGPFESLYRLHSRYYNFSLPFVLIIISGLFSGLEAKKSRFSWVIYSIFIFFAIYAFSLKLSPFIPGLIDSPEIYGFVYNENVFYIVGIFSIIALAVVQFRPSISAKFYFLCVALPVATSSFYYTTVEQRSHLVADAYDSAGIFAKEVIPVEEMHQTLVIGSALAGLYKTLFHMDYPASLQAVSEGEVFDLDKVSQDKHWIVAVGSNHVVGNYIYKNSLPGVTIYRVKGAGFIDFKRSFWPGVILSSHGLSSPESWGTWSNSGSVYLELAEVLPSNFTLKILASAFGPNFGQDFVVKIGKASASFLIQNSDVTEVNLNFSGIENSKVIEIIIPEPTSPKDLGVSGDQRKLGVGLISMEIIPK